MLTARRRLLVLLIAIFPCQLCLADGVYRDGIGARSVGRGGTNIGFADNGQMLLDNPAGMSNLTSQRIIGVGADILFTDMEYQDSDNPRTAGSNNPFPVGQISIIQRSLDRRLGVGLGVYSQAGFGATYDLNGPAPFSGPQRYKSLGAMSRILSGASFRVADDLTVGASFGAAISHIELEGPYTLQGPHAFRGVPLLLDMQSTGIAPSWSVGLQYDVSDNTRIGLSMVGETRFSMDGNTQTQIAGLPAARFDSTLDIAWPRTVGGGIKHRINDKSTLALDVLWINWANSFDSLALHLSNPDDPTVAAVTGGPFTEEYPLDWSDTVSFRSGYELELENGQTARFGYVYHSNPIPSSTLTPFIQTTLQHAVSVGYGWNFGRLDLDVAYQFSFGNQQDVGTSNFVGGDFDNSSTWLDAHWLLFEVMYHDE